MKKGCNRIIEKKLNIRDEVDKMEKSIKILRSKVVLLKKVLDEEYKIGGKDENGTMRKLPDACGCNPRGLCNIPGFLHRI
jgi:hypothetical protein